MRQDGRKGRPRPPVPFDEDCEECRVDDCSGDDGDDDDDGGDDDDDDGVCYISSMLPERDVIYRHIIFYIHLHPRKSTSNDITHLRDL